MARVDASFVKATKSWRVGGRCRNIYSHGEFVLNFVAHHVLLILSPIMQEIKEVKQKGREATQITCQLLLGCDQRLGVP